MSAPDVWEEIVACRRRGEAAALATIVSTLGSTPGKDPMKMLVRGDGTFVGSVGGGCLEAEVWEHARTVMATLRPMTVTFSLTEADYPDSGLICGGQVTVFIEPVTLPVVHVFGAGHVGAATAALARQAGFRVRLYDDRPDLLDAAAAGSGAEAVPGPFEETAAQALGPLLRETGPSDARFDVNFVIVVTRGHNDDERVLRALAARGRLPRFVGMIGSQAKRKVLLGRLARDGVPREWLDAVVSPVGLPIGARTAAEIAVSIVAQLVQEVRGPSARGAAQPAARASRGGLASVVLLAALLAGQARADTIVPFEGPPLDGVRIESETWSRIGYGRPGVPTPQTVPASEVRSVEYGSTSPEYRDGRERLAEGDLDGAVQAFLGAAEDGELPPFVRAAALATAADQLLLLGRADEALASWDELLAEHPDTRHLPRARLGRGRALLALGELDAAAGAFTRLRAEARDKSLGEGWTLQAEVFALAVQEARGQLAGDEALTAYAELRGRAGGAPPGATARAALRLGRLHLATGPPRLDEAAALFDEVLDQRLDADEEVVAGAWNGRGRCLFERGEPRAARLAFLRVYTHHPHVQAEQAEALYWAAECFLELDEQDAVARARVLQQRLVDRFPGSEWAQKISG